MIKPTDHKLHVRVRTVVNPYLAQLVKMCMSVGYVEVTNTENYTNFFVYIPSTSDREYQQGRLNGLFLAAGYSLW